MKVSTWCFRDPAGARILKMGPRRVRWATSAILLAFPWTIGLATEASAQNISVTEGDVQSNVAPTTYDSISVSGTSALGAPSTYTAAADLTLTNGLSVSSSGVFNANANVTAGGVSSSSDGVINLNSGTLTAGNLSLSGSSSVARTGGYYSVSNLYLSNGASLTYGDGDSITNYLSLDGASLSRTRAINAGHFNVSNATLDLVGGDSFNRWADNYITNNGVLNVNADVTVAGNVRTYSGGVVNLNGDLTVGGELLSYPDGVLNLNNFNLTASGLHVGGPSSFTRTSGNYSVGNLYLSNGASLTYGDGDSITNHLSLNGGSLSRTRTINAGSFSVSNATLDLITGDSFAGGSDIHSGGVVNVNGDITVAGAVSSWGVISLNSGTLTAGSLGGSGPGSVTRTGGHYSVGNLHLSNGAALTYGDGDSISGGIYLNGGSLSRTRTINAGSFGVSNATLDLITGDSFAGGSDIHSGGVVNVNGDTTVAGAVSSWGVINLNSGTLTAGSLGGSGPSSVTRTGGHYAVSNLYLSNGASLTYSDGDAITNYLSIDGISSSFAGYEPLSLNSLSITNGGVLSLHDFTGSGAISNWGLRLLGDSQSFLETLITGSQITGSWGPMSVFYDPTSNYTFVTAIAAVPEIDPAGIGSVMALVSGTFVLLERRRRRSA